MAPVSYAAALALLSSVVPIALADYEHNFGPQPALSPAVHWDHNKADLQHLLPVDNHNLYYSANGISDPTLEHAFGQIVTTLSHPAVILDHSSYIDHVQCSGPSLKVVFTDAEGYNFAKNAWMNETNFMLVTYTTGCGTVNNQRSFWLIDHLVAGNDNTITAVIEREIATEDALDDVDLVWGTYTPTKGSKKRARSLIHERQDPNPAATGTCGPPSSKVIGGFPAATCGSATFDKDLDDAIGYFDFSEDHYSQSLQGFAPGLGDFSPEANEGFGPTVGLNGTRLDRRLDRRALGTLISKFMDIIAKAMARTWNKSVDALAGLGGLIKQGAKGVQALLVDGLTVTPSINMKATLNVVPKAKDVKQIPAFPGSSVEMFRSKSKKSNRQKGSKGVFAVYCVECGATGSISYSGHARWNSNTGLNQATLNVQASLRAKLQVGVIAEVNGNQQKSIPIVSQGIPGFGITNVFALGPSVYLEATYGAEVSISGTVLAGATASIPIFAAEMDFVAETAKFTGTLKPEITQTFEANGQVSADIALGLPLGIAFGLAIPKAKNFRKALTISNKPAIAAKAVYSTGNTCNPSNKCLNGVAYGINLVNNVEADIFGFKQIPLAEYSHPIVDQCKPIGAQLTCPAAGSPIKRSVIDHHDAEYAPHLRKRQEGGAATSVPAAATSAAAASAAAATSDLDPLPSEAPLSTDLSPAQPIESSIADSSIFANSNITKFSTNDSANDEFFQTLQAAAFANLDSLNGTTSNSSVTPYADDTNFIYIRDLSGQDELDADADGNVYYTTPGQGTQFATVSGFVEADSSGRFFHYYTDIMAAYNVSRLRLSKELYIPRTADFVGLAPVNYDHDNTTQDVYVAMDTVGGLFYPVTCDLENQPSKAFLVTDVATGTQKLMDPLLRNTVTGGIVQRCYYLPWAAPSGSQDAIPGQAYPLSASGIDPTATTLPVSAVINGAVPTGAGAAAASMGAAAAAPAGGVAAAATSAAPAS